MFIVRVYTLDPGDLAHERLIGTAVVANVEKVKDTEDSYRYVATFEGLPALHVEHVRSRGFWKLVSDALIGALIKGEQNVLDRKPKNQP